MATARERAKQTQQLPSAGGDFYGIADALSVEDREIVRRVRESMEEKVAPIINDYWRRAEFPYDLLPEMAPLEAAGLS